MKQLIIFVVLCLPLLYSCGVPQQQETDTAYKTLTIKSGDQILKTGYTATLRGRQNVEIRPQVIRGEKRCVSKFGRSEKS